MSIWGGNVPPPRRISMARLLPPPCVRLWGSQQDPIPRIGSDVKTALTRSTWDDVFWRRWGIQVPGVGFCWSRVRRWCLPGLGRRQEGEGPAGPAAFAPSASALARWSAGGPAAGWEAVPGPAPRRVRAPRRGRPWRARWAACSPARRRDRRRGRRRDLRAGPARPAWSRRRRGRAIPTARSWTSWRRPSRCVGRGGGGRGRALAARRRPPAARSPPRLALSQACFASLVSQDYVNGTDQEEIRTGEEAAGAEGRVAALPSAPHALGPAGPGWPIGCFGALPGHPGSARLGFTKALDTLRFFSAGLKRWGAGLELQVRVSSPLKISGKFRRCIWAVPGVLVLDIWGQKKGLKTIRGFLNIASGVTGVAHPFPGGTRLTAVGG